MLFLLKTFFKGELLKEAIGENVGLYRSPLTSEAAGQRPEGKSRRTTTGVQLNT
jgi:hypothetical protein